MTQSFFKSLTSGFARVGSSIMADKQKQDDEVEAYSKKYTLQKQMDVQAQKDLEDYKDEKLKKARNDVMARLNAKYIGSQVSGLPEGVISQGNVALNAPAEEPVININDDGSIDTGTAATIPSTAGEIQSNDLPPAQPAPVAAPVDNTAATAVTPPAAAVAAQTSAPNLMTPTVTRDDVLRELSTLPASSWTNPAVDPLQIAEGKAMQKAQSRGPQVLNATANAARAGIDPNTGQPMSYIDQNPSIVENVKSTGISPDILSPLLFAKGPAAQQNIQSAMKAQSDYYYGAGANAYGSKLAQVEGLNDKFRTILGLAKDANTGMFSGPANVMLSKLSSDSNATAELNKMAAAVGPSMRPPGSGSSSDPDMKLYMNSIADVQSGKGVNVDQMMNLLNQGSKVEQKMQAGALLQNKFTLVNPAKSEELFQQYWSQNPDFIKQGPSITENPNKITFEEWLANRNTPTGAPVDTAAGASGAPAPQAASAGDTKLNSKVDSLIQELGY